MRRPGLWVTNGHPGNSTQMLSWRPGALTCFYDYLGVNGVFPYKAANPEASIIVRFQHPLNWQQDPVGFAKSLGEQVASKWRDMKILDPYVYFANEMNLHYENGDRNPGNQPYYASSEFYKKYANWVRMTADVIKNIVPEMKLVSPPLAFGHSEDGSPDDNGQPTEGWAGYDFLADTIRDYFSNILCFHSYWGDASGSKRDQLYDPVQSSWYAFRWRRLLKLFETRYGLSARLIIDEAGNFGAADPDFTDQIIYHAQQCLTDDRVIAVTYFLWLDPTNSPGNIANSWVQRVRNLPDHLARLAALPDIPVTTVEAKPPAMLERPQVESSTVAPTIRVLFPDGTVRVMALEDYLRAVVPAEVPALWPFEAVKAQAVAARSYAQYAIEHPRHPNADICTSPAHCQNFDLAKVHPKSDEAIQQTQGIIARYNGITTNGIFSANCGGQTRNNEDVFKGAPVAYLRSVPCPDKGEKNGHGVGLCQYGARLLASQGQTYDTIIKYYYTGVTLGSVTTERTSTILGTILDFAGKPALNIKATLIGQGQSASTVTQTDGTYRFANVPAGTYTLELPDFGLRQANLTPTPGQDLRVNLTLPAPPPPQPAIVVDIVRGAGLPLLVGDWGVPNVPIQVKPPLGPALTILSGSKREYGPGGFEMYALQTGVYVLTIDSNRFEVPMSGQYTRLTFRRTAPAQPTGVIEGTLVDYQNRPVARRQIRLTGSNVALGVATSDSGSFRFDGVPAGSYTMTVADSQISQNFTHTGQGKVTLALQLPAPPSQWQVSLQPGQGLPLLVGDIGLPNTVITVISPAGRTTQVTSGSKPEWGLGGFELYASELGNYTLQFLGQSFVIPVQGQLTKAIFQKQGVSPDQQVRLVSTLLPRSRAEALQQALEASAETRGVFTVQGVS
ncbi:MAG: SpoIID/LytB domain-containing protein [Anaerolineae bacterium]